MRGLAFLPLLALAACGDDGAAVRNEAPAAPAAVAAGQWTLESNVTQFAKADNGAPRIDTPVGTRASETVCVGPGDTPPPALFAGEGNDCHGDSIYARNGRVSVQMTCTRHGLSGAVLIGANGSFTGDTIEYDRDVRTNLVTDGDVTMNVHVTGRRTGACAPERDGAGNAGAAAGNHAG